MQNTRVSLVTGGTEGIGRAVALELARRGDRVLISGRDTARGASVLAALRDAAPGLDHRFLPADLALVAGAVGLARAVGAATSRLDAIVCCAGILSTMPESTTEGLERTFVLNYLSRYVLARMLLPMLAGGPCGRLVLVASAGKYKDTLDLSDLRRGRRGLALSGGTQFANDLLAQHLAERCADTRVEVSCVFPGMVRTRVFANARGLPWLFRMLVPILRRFQITPEVAADTPVFLARGDTDGTNGGFFGPRRTVRAVPARARDAARIAQLIAASEDVVSPFLVERAASCVGT